MLNDHGQCVDPNACTCAYNGKIYKVGVVRPTKNADVNHSWL